MRWLADPRLTMVGLLEETRAGLRDRFAEQLAEHGLSPLEFEVLLRLARTPDQRLRMSDLAEQVLMSASGLTRVADRLEAAGLLLRATCDEDRRGTWAVLTDAGLRRLLAALPGHLDVVDRWFTGVLTDAELETVTDVLRRVRDLVRPQATTGVAATA
jgi:DNA-binding MarR family transcriptional regulator